MTAVEYLAERYNYITWMRNRDEISAGTADEWRAKFLKEAKEMEDQKLKQAWEELLTNFAEWLEEEGYPIPDRKLQEYLKYGPHIERSEH